MSAPRGAVRHPDRRGAVHARDRAGADPRHPRGGGRDPGGLVMNDDPKQDPNTPPASDASPQGATPELPSQQEMAIRSALETVMDPEINLSVIDLGLIREVDVKPGATHVKMMLTTPFGPYAPQMIADVKQATEHVAPQPGVVEIPPEPARPDLR